MAHLDDYFRRTLEENVFSNIPTMREDDHLTPATRLLEKRREMAEVEQALNAQKEEFQMKMESLQQRREELERKEHQLKESFLKFDKFLKENDSKRARALKKAAEEKVATRSKVDDIGKLSEEIQSLTLYRDKTTKKLSKYAKFQHYMDRVLEIADEFQEIRDITQRYETLMMTHNQLLLRENRNQDKIEQDKNKLNMFIEEKKYEILNDSNKLAVLQTELEKTQSRAMFWESRWTRIQDTAARKTLQLGRVKMTTHNLFNLVNKHTNQVGGNETTEEQLQRIQMFIMDLTQITEEIKSSENIEN